jgi:hypothetical protein
MNLHDSNARTLGGGHDPLAALKRLVRPLKREERCELCGLELASAHPHLLERRTRRISCSCGSCAILFCGLQGARFLRIPQAVHALGDFYIRDLEWEQLLIPIQMAFFFRSEDGRIVAMYPSAAGAVESQLTPEYLTELFHSHPALSAMQPEVEALLVNRIGERHTYLVAPIDECFRLTGLIRAKWRGLSGGTEVWTSIARFLDDLQRRAERPAQEHHA